MTSTHEQNHEKIHENTETTAQQDKVVVEHNENLELQSSVDMVTQQNAPLPWEVEAEQQGVSYDEAVNAETAYYAKYQQGVTDEDYLVEEDLSQNVKIYGEKDIDTFDDNLVNVEEYTDTAVNSNIKRMQTPGRDDEFYANEQASLDYINAKQEREEGWSDKEAEQFAMVQGLESVLRENAQLNLAIKESNRTKKLSLMVSAALAILLSAMIFAFTQYPKTKYIATKDNTALCTVDPKNNPNISDTTITEFAKTAVLELYSLDYVNSADQVEKVTARYYTLEGRADAVAALRNMGTIDHLTRNALTLRASAMNTPRIIERTMTAEGHPMWKVQFPIVMDVFSGSIAPKETQYHLITVRVRADQATATNPTGLGVLSTTFEPYSPNSFNR